MDEAVCFWSAEKCFYFSNTDLRGNASHIGILIKSMYISSNIDVPKVIPITIGIALHLLMSNKYYSSCTYVLIFFLISDSPRKWTKYIQLHISIFSLFGWNNYIATWLYLICFTHLFCPNIKNIIWLLLESIYCLNQFHSTYTHQC